MTRLSALMVTTATLWLLAPIAAGLSGAEWGVIPPLAAAMFAVQLAGKPHLLRQPQPAQLIALALGALLFAALGWAAGRGLSVLLGAIPTFGGAVPWVMLAISGAASWRIRGLSDPAMGALLEEATRDLNRMAGEIEAQAERDRRED